MCLAVEHGAMSILRYGLEHRKKSTSDPKTLYLAAFKGRVEVVDLLLQGRCSTPGYVLAVAAARGHLACVRHLHKRGFPLWDHVVSVRNHDDWFAPDWQCSFGMCSSAFNTRLVVPETAHVAQCLWGVMRYGEMHGAPLPESAGWVFEERRKRARQALLCFHGATRLSTAAGKEGLLWGVIARVPIDVVYKILVAAELEMEETFKP
jgi:hypothetical protein